MVSQEIKTAAKILLAKIAELNVTLIVVLDNVFPIVEVGKDGKEHLFLTCYLDKRSKDLQEAKFVSLLQSAFQFSFRRGFSGIKDGEMVCPSYDSSWRRKVVAPKVKPAEKSAEKPSSNRPKPISLD